MSGWYVAASKLKDFLMYYDDLIAFRSTYTDETFERLRQIPKIIVHMSNELSLDLVVDKDEDALACEIVVVKEGAGAGVAMQGSVFALPPPTFPLRIVILEIEMLSKATAHLIFGGNTRPFQSDFVRCGIKGRSVKASPGDAYGEYFRVLENVDFGKRSEFVLKVKELHDDILKQSPMVIRIQDTDVDKTEVLAALSHADEVANIRVVS